MLTEVVHQDDLLQKGPGHCVKDALHGPQEGGPGLVVETEDDAGSGQAVSVVLLQTPVGKRSREPWEEKTKKSTGPPLTHSLGPGWGCFNQIAPLPPNSVALLLEISMEREPITPSQ